MTESFYQMIIFLVITILFIIGVIVFYLREETENLQVWTTYFDNCTSETFLYKYYIEIHFKDIPRQMHDYIRGRQLQKDHQYGSLSIVIQNAMRRLLSHISLESEVLCDSLSKERKSS